MKSRNCFLTGLLLLIAGVAQAQVVTKPPGLAPGQPYRLAFLSSTVSPANSKDINVYNKIVDDLAEAVPELAALKQDWKVIASTAAVTARANTSTDPSPAGKTGVPIFLRDGTKLADDYDDLWDGKIDNNLNVFEDGTHGRAQPLVWTGTTSSGLAFASHELGASGFPRVGQHNATGTWINLDNLNGFDGNATPLRLYAISGVLGAKELAVDLGGGVKMEMVLIPAGSFLMGDDDAELYRPNPDGAKPVHKVRITKPFYLGKYEVTQEQWEAVMGSNPSDVKGPKNPVETISWDDCRQFLVKLNAKSGGQGGKFVLPTEAQWEYACRAGSAGRFCFGDDEKQLGEYAWYDENSGGTTHAVGGKKPNTFGLHDMYGNVSEWCQDWYGAYGAEAVDEPSGPTTGTYRVPRGGSWFDASWGCRSAYRDGGEPEYRDDQLGFRVARVPAD